MAADVVLIVYMRGGMMSLWSLNWGHARLDLMSRLETLVVDVHPPQPGALGHRDLSMPLICARVLGDF
jgi:hypothetical protein